MSIRILQAFGTKASTCCCSEPKAFPLPVFCNLWSRNRTVYVLLLSIAMSRQTVMVSQKLIYQAKQPVNITTTQAPCGLSEFLHEKIRGVAVMSRVLHTVVCIFYWTQTVLLMLFVVYLNHWKGYYILNHFYISVCKYHVEYECWSYNKLVMMSIYTRIRLWWLSPRNLRFWFEILLWLWRGRANVVFYQVHNH